MPRLDHRKLESLFSPPSGATWQIGDGEEAVRRRKRIKAALFLQSAYSAFTVVFALYEIFVAESLVHKRPPAELLKVVAYSGSCLIVYRSVSAYLRLMFVWTITTAFSGVYQSLAWLEGGGGSDPEVCLVWALLILSVAGMIGNILGALSVFPCGGSPGKAKRRRVKTSLKES